MLYVWPPDSGSFSVRETCAVTPKTRYARTADGVHIAYQVHGDGPIDLLMALGWTTNIEALWEGPSMARFPTDWPRRRA